MPGSYSGPCVNFIPLLCPHKEKITLTTKVGSVTGWIYEGRRIGLTKSSFCWRAGRETIRAA